MNFSQKKQIKIALMPVLVGLVIFSFFQTISAQDLLDSNSNENSEVKQEKRLPDQNLKISSDTNSQNNPLFYGSKALDLERTLPFFSMPFTNYQLTFDSENRKFFQAGETVLINAEIEYSSQNSEKEVKNTQEKCFADQKEKSEEQKQIVCESPPVYYFPSFSNVGVLIQIWRQEEDKDKMQAKGDNLIDEFYGANNLTLKEKEPKDFLVKWKIPENLKAGKYYATFFMNQNKNFTLFGFPVNIFSPYSRFDFEIIRGEGGLEGGVRIDKDNIKINNKDYSQVQPALAVERENGNVNFEIPVLNPGEKEEIGTVTTKLFRWTQENPQDLITEKNNPFSLPAGSQETVRFGFAPQENDSFLNLQVIVETEKSKTMTDIHFAVNDLNRGVIRFLGLANERNSDNPTPLFCLRNAQWQGAYDGKFKIEFLDEAENLLRNWEATGQIEARDGVCFVIKNQAISNFAKNNCLKIKGVIEDKNGKTSDEKEVAYNCKESATSSSETNALEKKQDDNNTITLQKKREAILFTSGLVFILAILIIFGVRKYLKNKDEENENHIV